MEDVVENSVEPEVAPPQTENHVVAEEKQPEVEKPVDDKQERNWREMRRRQQELEQRLKEKDEMIERVLRLQQGPAAPQEVDELESVSDEEFLPKGKQKKLVKKEVEPLLREIDELKKQVNQQKQNQFVDNLRRQYPDFSEVVNPDTLALFEEQEPELAATIADSKDPYKMGIQSYKYIKALGLVSKAPEARHAKEVDKKLEKNAKTVQSPQAYDKRPMAQAFKLTDSEKTKIYEEMMQYAGQAGFGY